MLELRNITYEVDDNNENKEILKNVSVTIDDHFCGDPTAVTKRPVGKSTLCQDDPAMISPDKWSDSH